MARLTGMEIAVFNRAVLELNTAQTAGEFSTRVYESFRLLISCDLLVVDCLSNATGLSLACQCFPTAMSEELNAIGHVLQEAQSPVWMKCFDGAQSISDNLSRAHWHSLALYHDGYHHLGQEDSLSLDIRLSDALSLSLVCARSCRGFRSGERDLLNLFGPHVRQLHQRLAVQNGPAATSLVTWVVPLSRNGNALNWPSSARTALGRQGIHVVRDELPEVLAPWFLESKQALDHPLTSCPALMRLAKKRHLLRLYLMRDLTVPGSFLLVLEESQIASPGHALQAFGVTRREREVLQWLTQGKTNAEIAGILGISHGTVRRHLENVFPKLGVENRHAATLTVRQILDANDRLGVLG